MANEKNTMCEKNRSLYVINRYKYGFHKCLKNNIDWYCCIKKTFKAYIQLNTNNVIIEQVINHNHQNNSDETLNRQTVSN